MLDRHIHRGKRCTAEALTGGDVLRLIVNNGLRLSIFGLVDGAVAVAGATALVMRYLNVRQLDATSYLFSIAESL